MKFLHKIFISLLIIMLGNSTQVFSQSEPPSKPIVYEYALLVKEPNDLASQGYIRIYYGNGKVEDAGQWKEVFLKNMDTANFDLLVTIINHMSEQNYELFNGPATFSFTAPAADESARLQYLFRRVKQK